MVLAEREWEEWWIGILGALAVSYTFVESLVEDVPILTPL
jgi:hypothetical protein